MPMVTNFEARLREVMAPDPHKDPVEFLENNVRTIPYSPQSGPFRISNSPWLAEPLRCLTDPEVQEIGALGCVQSGKSWLIEGASLIIPALAPGPTLILQDIDRNANDFLETRLRVLWDSVPKIKSLIGPDGVPKQGAIQFRGNTCWVLGANNERNLQRRSIRYILGDEVWLWGNGNLKEALARTTAFRWQSKVVLVSQGGTEGDDWSNWFETTDKRVWSFVCPSCNHQQPFLWEQIVYPASAKVGNTYDLEAVRAGTTYKCRNCDHHFKDSNQTRAEMNASASYVITNPTAPKSRRGYHWNALCGQWGLSWGDLAVERLEAWKLNEESGNLTALREFTQKRLAISWREETYEVKLDAEVGDYKMADQWDEEGGFVKGKPTPGRQITAEHRSDPDFVPFRFMTVDVQQNGFYWLVRSWDGEGKSRLRGCGFAMSWANLGECQKKHGVHPANVFVDCGYQKDEVITACGERGWNAIRGDQRNDFVWRIRLPNGAFKNELRAYSQPVVEMAGTKRCKVFYFSNLRFKDSLAAMIKWKRHTRAADVPEDYVEQMQSEKRIINNNGKVVWEVVDRKANHFWDCEVMGLLPALAWRLTGKLGDTTEAANEAGSEAPTA